MEHQPHSSKVFDHATAPAISPVAEAKAGPEKVERYPEDPLHPRLGCQSTASLPKAVVTQPRATGNDAAVGIGQAYDRFHRIQAILAYLKIINRNDRWFSPILDEAKCTYEQALSLYEARDFEGALEFALASGDLFQALEIIISNGLRSDSLYPTLMQLPPEHQTTLDDSIQMQEELYRVERLLSLIHRVAEKGTLLSEDQTHALNIASCSERLLRKVRHLLKFATVQEAIDLAHAAAMTAHAAEHVCKRWSATQGIDPVLPPQHSRAKCNESSGRDRDSNSHSRTLELQEE
jgi:hypothetical protein